jgi:5-oxoprolinase (ATP-hydrolysing) subunit A
VVSVLDSFSSGCDLMPTIDLNCDMGELPEAIADGTQEALLRSITSANVACGGHAGDMQMMRTTIEQAIQAGVAVGAHPGYPDRTNFGRFELKMSPEALADSICQQVRALAEIAAACRTRLVQVKPHGALYNQAVKDRTLAEAFANGVAQAIDAEKRSTRGAGFIPQPVLVGLAGSPMLDVFRQAGFPVAAEGFADRRYETDGTLRSRKFDDALIRDPAEAARQAVSIAQRGIVTAHDGSQVKLTAQTICIHGDPPGAPQIAAAVAHALREAGISLRGLASTS